MADDKVAELLKTQKSLTEWLEDIHHKDAAAIRNEDNEKRERLKVLNDIIGLPFDRPTQFTARDLSDNSKKFKAYFEGHKNDLCALRIIPLVDGLPKLRMRGRSIEGAVEWFHEQQIDPDKYRVDIMPHSAESYWATIFVVNHHGISGEITRGSHEQLTQGFHSSIRPYVFSFDFQKWNLDTDDKEVLAHIKKLIAYLKVDDQKLRQDLTRELGAEFEQDYLKGYFETTDTVLGTWFIDYSPTLGKLYEDFSVQPQVKKPGQNLVTGMVGCAGKTSGKVKIVDPDKLDADFPDGSILVCKVTTPNYVPLMQKAAAIITDQGGILSHAAIVARELKKPCIVGTGNATSVLKNGQTVMVDADNGTVEVVR